LSFNDVLSVFRIPSFGPDFGSPGSSVNGD